MTILPITLTREDVIAALRAEREREPWTVSRPIDTNIQPGDLLWVREPWGLYHGEIVLSRESHQKIPGLTTGESVEGHELQRTDALPRNASRLTLEISSVAGNDIVCKVHKINVDKLVDDEPGRRP